MPGATEWREVDVGWDLEDNWQAASTSINETQSRYTEASLSFDLVSIICLPSSFIGDSGQRLMDRSANLLQKHKEGLCLNQFYDCCFTVD